MLTPNSQRHIILSTCQKQTIRWACEPWCYLRLGSASIGQPFDIQTLWNADQPSKGVLWFPLAIITRSSHHWKSFPRACSFVKGYIDLWCLPWESSIACHHSNNRLLQSCSVSDGLFMPTISMEPSNLVEHLILFNFLSFPHSLSYSPVPYPPQFCENNWFGSLFLSPMDLGNQIQSLT